MITVLDVLKDGLHSMHNMLDKAVGDMNAGQFNFRPMEGGLTPFFSLWHYVRTEDNIVNFVIQGANTVWLDGGFDTKFGLPRTAQGTGMSDAQAAQIRLLDVDLWREYQAKVWQATDQFLQVLQPARRGGEARHDQAHGRNESLERAQRHVSEPRLPPRRRDRVRPRHPRPRRPDDIGLRAFRRCGAACGCRPVGGAGVAAGRRAAGGYDVGARWPPAPRVTAKLRSEG